MKKAIDLDPHRTALLLVDIQEHFRGIAPPAGWSKRSKAWRRRSPL